MLTEQTIENPFRLDHDVSKEDYTSQYDSQRSLEIQSNTFLSQTLPLYGALGMRGEALPYQEAIKCIERI